MKLLTRREMIVTSSTRCTARTSFLLSCTTVLLFLTPQNGAFTIGSSSSSSSTRTAYRQRWHRPTTLQQLGYAKNEGPDGDRFDAEVLQERLWSLRVKLMDEELQLPPNAQLKPTEFVTKIIDGLYHHADPLPDAGFRTLIRSSTALWKKKLYDAVGAPIATARMEDVASALGEAMARSHNQFGILVGEGERYYVTFPSDTLDYGDGTCWLECHLRNAETDELLVITGWQLKQRSWDGAWLIDTIDWQDFRDGFRPGIGREEWMRICG